QPSTDMYDLLELKGEGRYGKVLKCLNNETGEIVAVKAIKICEKTDYVIAREVFMLDKVSALDPDLDNVIRFNKYFKSADGHHCMEFELLDLSVEDLMKKRRAPFSLNEIRPMAKDLLISLKGLRNVGVMHTDLKPDNVMCVDQQNKPFKVKLIDFGVATLTERAKVGKIMQPLGYRAPEVTLGLPLTEAVDMWSLGCCLLEWYLSVLPFPAESPYDHMQMITHFMGMITHFMGVPDGELIKQAMYGNDYFVEEGSEWRLKEVSEYKATTGVTPIMEWNPLQVFKDLEDVILNCHQGNSELDIEDRRVFVDLLQKMFHVDPDKRITPAEALIEGFMSLLSEYECEVEDGDNPADMYDLLEFMGEGCYGKVMKCLNKETGEIVALKAIKMCEYADYFVARELYMMDKVSALDPDVDNIIRFNKYFKSTDGRHCMEFELLDLSLDNLMKRRRAPFSLNEIRPMAKDLLISLKGLRSVGVMHTDVKPDNVMIVDHQTSLSRSS
uniref:Protein kinase domain-containing protein n=1 Tax=Neogobius melanostomus TaxID=47308 RepID=A0A8C6V9H2_9GOBI